MTSPGLVRQRREQHTYVRVGLGARAYEIVVGPGVLGEAAGLAAQFVRNRKVFIVTDETVAKHHLSTLAGSLTAGEIEHDAIVLPPGEQTKSFAHLESLLDRLLAAGLDRSMLLIALGGGVIGDLVGFAAAVALRGIDFIQAPTTLLAQVDSSVGGKTAIDSPHGKNLIGAFHQPRLVLADLATLDTLPKRERLAGYAEIVKYGLLGDKAFFDWCESNGARAVSGEREPLTHAIVASCRHKAEIVEADEREAGRRALLNLGHTFAHALETESGFGDALLHGEAVAIGMVLACELSRQLGLIPATDVARVRKHFANVGLPVSPVGGRLAGKNWSIDALIAHMRKDKKALGGKLTFVLVRGIGDAFVARDVDEAAVRRVMQDALAA